MQLTQKHEGHASPKLGPLEDAARLSNWLCFRERRYEKMGCVGGKPASASGRRSSRAADLSFSANYKLGKTLGAGTYSVVKEGVHRATGTKFAVKIVKKSGLSDNDKVALAAEMEILKSLNHPNILELEEHFEDRSHYYLVTELLKGGELFDRLVEKEFYSEREARDLVQTLLGAIAYCHDHDVVHRDLKPENLLLKSRDDACDVKIADFGFAKYVGHSSTGGGLATACGTPTYVAPEILHGFTYGKPVDVWSVGVITYVLLAGYPPFINESNSQLFKMIRKGEYEFDSPYWDEVSLDAKRFITRMIEVNPTKRATARELLQDPWIVGDHIPDSHLESTVKELKAYRARGRFRAAVRAVQSVNRINKLVGRISIADSRSSASSVANASDSDAEHATDADPIPVADSEAVLAGGAASTASAPLPPRTEVVGGAPGRNGNGNNDNKLAVHSTPEAEA